MRMGALTAMALALGGLSAGAYIERDRRSYRSAQSSDGGAVCQYPVGFPLPAKRKPRTNKNRNYRKARKAKRLKQHIYNRIAITGYCDHSKLYGTCEVSF